MRIASSPARSSTLAPTPARNVGAIASSGRHQACSVASRSAVGVCHVVFSCSSHGSQSAWYSARYSALSVKIRGDLVVGQRMGHGALRRRAARSPCRGWPGCPSRPLAASMSRNTRWSGKMLSSSPVITLRWNSSGSRNTGGPARRHDGAGVDRLDVAHRPGELAVDLGVDERAHPLRRLVVDHRVPDGPAVLQPVQVHPAVAAQVGEVGGAAVVLVDQHRGAVVDHQRRVAAGAVGDARLHVDRHGELLAELHRLAVARAHEAGEAELAQLALLLAGRVAGEQDGGVAADVLGEPRLVEVIGVQVGDVQVGRVLDPLAAANRLSWSLRGNTNHEPKNAGRNHGSHRIDPSAVSMRMPA